MGFVRWLIAVLFASYVIGALLATLTHGGPKQPFAPGGIAGNPPVWCAGRYDRAKGANFAPCPGKPQRPGTAVQAPGDSPGTAAGATSGGSPGQGPGGGAPGASTGHGGGGHK